MEMEGWTSHYWGPISCTYVVQKELGSHEYKGALVNSAPAVE